MADIYCATDPMVICPLDKSHQIRKSRLIFHLVKCKKNHDLKDKAICSFNSTHIVDKHELTAHHLACLDRREILQYEVQYEEDESRWEGILSVADVIKAQELMPTQGENWDNDPPVGTYDPVKANENKEVICTLMVAPKSEKKAWRKMQRLKMAQFPQSPTLVPEVETPNEVQVKIAPEPVAVSEPVTRTERKPKNSQSPTFADQLATNLTHLNISDATSFNPEDFPSLQAPGRNRNTNVSSTRKARKSKK